VDPREKNADVVIPGTRGLSGALYFTPLIFLLFGAVGYVLLAQTDFEQQFLSFVFLGTGVVFAITAFVVLWKHLRPYRNMVGSLNRYIESAKHFGERYKLALQGANEGFWDYDIQKKQIYFSSRWMTMLGFTEKEETQPLTFWQELYHPEDKEGVIRAMEAHLDKRTPTFSVQYRVRRQTGEYMWVEESGKAMWDEKGKPARMAGVTKDIGNIKRVQEVLESRTAELEHAQEKIVAEIRNVEKFQKAVDSSTQAVAITDPQGVIVYVNSAWETLNQYTSLETLGRNPKILKSMKTNPDVFKVLWEKVKAGYPYHTEEVFNRRKDGSEYQADLWIYPIADEGTIIFFVSLLEDITQRKEVDRAKTEFVSLASHQLRTPLSAIRWYSEMLLSKYVGELNEKQHQYVKEIYAGNLRMVELVNALLNVSRIDLGTFAIEPEDTNLFELCDSVLSELTPQITEKKQSVNRMYDQNVALYKGDKKLLRIIFQNFLSNSVKYTQPEGQIIVEVARRDPDLLIRVSDNGYGIPKAQQTKIFEKLFRADNVRQKDTEGTGLGMYIVKAIVEQSGGKIWFDSEENKGTTFYVTLPLAGMPKKTGIKGLTS
jgi:PAS domain S-box-containing protein